MQLVNGELKHDTVTVRLREKHRNTKHYGSFIVKIKIQLKTIAVTELRIHIS